MTYMLGASNIVVDSLLSPSATLKVLIIEDDEALGLALAEGLERSGMRTICATNGAEGLALMRSFAPDIALVDLKLPDTDGIGLVSLLAQQGDCGIIIVSGLTDEADIIVGLDLGADDYVCKPTSPRELLARIRAVHRRVKMRSAVKTGVAARPAIQVGKITIDLKGRSVQSTNGDPIKLSAAEFTALETLLAASGQAVSRDSLSEAALNHPWRAEDRSVDRLIFNLRQKLAAGDDRRLIHSIRGTGYMLTATKGAPATELPQFVGA
jgi:two-component system, OmpR family, response regulator